jgi:hypothetical protein
MAVDPTAFQRNADEFAKAITQHVRIVAAEYEFRSSGAPLMGATMDDSMIGTSEALVANSLQLLLHTHALLCIQAMGLDQPKPNPPEPTEVQS